MKLPLFKTFFITGVLLGLGLFGCLTLWAAYPPKGPPPSRQKMKTSPPTFVPGHVLVRFRLEASLADLQQILEGTDATGHYEICPWGLYLITFNEETPVTEMVDSLQAHPLVLYAEPNYKLEAFNHAVSAASVDRFGEEGVSSPLTVALLDAGFDLSREPLKGRLFSHGNEKPDDGIDNDGNGYIDDTHGYDFLDYDPDPDREGSSVSHGTDSILRALDKVDNPLTFLPLRVGSGNKLLTSAICQAVQYAADQGVDLITLSLGKDPMNSTNWWNSRPLVDALEYASKQKVLLLTMARPENRLWPRPAFLQAFPESLWMATTEEPAWNAGFLYKEARQLVRLTLPNPYDLTDLTSQGNRLKNHRSVTASEGKVGGAAQFATAQAQYLSVQDRPSLSFGDASFSIALWVYFDSLPLYVQQGILAKASDEKHVEYALYVENTPPNIRFLISNNGSITAVESDYHRVESLPILEKRWYFIVATYDASSDRMFLYLNNVASDGRAQLSGGPYDGTSDLEIGRELFTTRDPRRQYLDGRIDEVGLWKKVLSDRERADLYNDGRGNTYVSKPGAFVLDTEKTLTQGLAAYFNLDEYSFRWRIGHAVLDPFPLIGLVGLFLFLYSSGNGAALFLEGKQKGSSSL